MRMDAELKAIHESISDLLLAVRGSEFTEAMRKWLSLRAKLALARQPLPKTIGLMTTPLDKINPSSDGEPALADIEKAIQDLWTRGQHKKQIHSVKPELPATPPPGRADRRDSGAGLAEGGSIRSEAPE